MKTISNSRCVYLMFQSLFLAGTAALLAEPIRNSGDPTPSAGSYASSSMAATGVTSAITTPQDPEPDAPGVSSSIEGINFDEGAAINSGIYNIPPDPIGAAGPNHVVSVVNTSIEWHTKAGVQQLSQKLGTSGFFAPLSPVNGTFDPKVIYDQHAGRFVVVTLERVDNGSAASSSANTSRILVAVSDDSDPNGTWRYLSINSKIAISGVDRWADYPGLGVDEDAIYITNNMFTFGTGAYGGTRLWIINKTPLYTGGTGTFTVHDPFASAGVATTAQPAHILGTPPSGSTGTFLVSYSGLSDGTNEYIQTVRVDNPLATPTFNVQQLNVGNIDTVAAFPNAPQSGTADLVWTNDSRTINAVWRNNRLYTAASTMPTSGTNVGQVTARFWELNTTILAAITQVQSGEIGGEDIATGAYTFFPSIATNAAGDICVGFSASASTIFPGAYAVVRLSGDTLGTVRPALTVAAGVASYKRTFGGSRNRWGDYSGTCVDPSNDSDFWIFNEYAMAQGTAFGSPSENGRWATRWAKIDVAAQTPTLTAPATASVQGSATNVNFSLPEAAQAGTLTLAFTGPASRTLTLATSQETSGAHSFTFNPANPTATAAIASITGGTTIPDGIYTVTLSYKDTLANGPATAVSTNVVIDTTAPTISIGSPSTSLTKNGPVTYTITYSDSNFSTSTLTTGNITLNTTGTANGTLGVTGSGNTRTVTISSITGNGTLGISIAAGTASDTAGNTAAAAGPSTTFTVDNTAPAVVVSSASATSSNQTFNFTLTFSESVTGLTVSGITVTNGTKGTLTGSGTTYTLPVTATVTGNVTCKVNAAVAADAATNSNTASNTATVQWLTAQEAWRLLYFGIITNTGNAADNADPDGDGNNNKLEFVAGLIPNNASSRFSISAQPVPGQPGQKAIVFSPIIAGRTYVVKSSTTLISPTWANLTSSSTANAGNVRTVTDLAASQTKKFYHVEITLP